jgi:hypothetical protein
VSVMARFGKLRCRLSKRHAIPPRATVEELGGSVTRYYDDGAQQGVVPAITCPRCGAVIGPMDKGYPMVIPSEVHR